MGSSGKARYGREPGRAFVRKRAPSPSRTAGAAPVSSKDAPCNPRGPTLLGLAPPEGTGGKGPLRTLECIIWHGRTICRAVRDTVVLHPRRPVSFKISPQNQIQIQIQFPPPPPSFSTPNLGQWEEQYFQEWSDNSDHG